MRLLSSRANSVMFDTGTVGIPAANCAAADAGAGDGDAQAAGTAETRTADAGNAVHLSAGW
jgi:hypothetical protein